MKLKTHFLTEYISRVLNIQYKQTSILERQYEVGVLVGQGYVGNMGNTTFQGGWSSNHTHTSITAGQSWLNGWVTLATWGHQRARWLTGISENNSPSCQWAHTYILQPLVHWQQNRLIKASVLPLLLCHTKGLEVLRNWNHSVWPCLRKHSLRVCTQTPGEKHMLACFLSQRAIVFLYFSLFPFPHWLSMPFFCDSSSPISLSPIPLSW